MAQHKPMRRPEIVAPAGDPSKLRTALHFGADAVYLGLKSYSMRANAGNFDFDELEWALGYARERGRRVYVCVNVQAFDEDFEGLESSLRTLALLSPDGVVVSDPGVFALGRQVAPALRFHLSTQSSVTNARAASFWLSRGMTRIVVARELDLAQLASLVAGCNGEIETFAHGAVCVATSGRCFLSLYWADRDPRVGDCAQACRWRYRAIEDQWRPGLHNPIEEDERGTYFFDAKDLCTIGFLDRLCATGVHALKIEGRTRSPHYIGVTVDVYRHALDRICAGDPSGFRESVGEYTRELERASRRGFSGHFYTREENDRATYTPDRHRLGGRADYLGQVVRNDGSAVYVQVQNPIRPRCRAELRDTGMLAEPADIDVLAGEHGEVLDIARTGTTIRIPGHFASTPGALLRVTHDQG